MLKLDELSDPTSCLNRAKDDEPVFVLLGRDLPLVLRDWNTGEVILSQELLLEVVAAGIAAVALRKDKQLRCLASDILGSYCGRTW